MSALPDLPAGTVYVPVLAGSTTPLSRIGPWRSGCAVQIWRCRSCRRYARSCPRPWLVATRTTSRSFQTFEHARLFVVALLDGQEPTC